MAKIVLAPTVSFISGKIANGIYYTTNKSGMSYIRNYAYPTITDHNHQIGSTMRNLTSIYVQQVTYSYKKEAKIYASLRAKQENIGKPYTQNSNNGLNYFILSIYNAAKIGSFPVSLDLITYIQLITYGDNINSISSACYNNLLPHVKGFESLTASF